MSFEVVQTYGVVSQGGLKLISASGQNLYILPAGATGSSGAVLTSDGTGSATWVGGSDFAAKHGFVTKADHEALLKRITILEAEKKQTK